MDLLKDTRDLLEELEKKHLKEGIKLTRIKIQYDIWTSSLNIDVTLQNEIGFEKQVELNKKYLKNEN